MICIFCNLEIKDGQLKSLVALEVPYMNLYVHRECLSEHKHDMKQFLSDNLEKYLQLNTKNKKT